MGKLRNWWHRQVDEYRANSLEHLSRDMERLEQKLAQCPKDQRLDYARQIGKAELDLAKLRRKANNEHVR